MEVPRFGVYATATAPWYLSHVCDLHHSSRQHWILNPPREARDQTCVLMDTSEIHFRWATTGTPFFIFYFSLFLVIFVLFWLIISSSNISWILVLSYYSTLYREFPVHICRETRYAQFLTSTFTQTLMKFSLITPGWSDFPIFECHLHL